MEPQRNITPEHLRRALESVLAQMEYSQEIARGFQDLLNEFSGMQGAEGGDTEQSSEIPENSSADEPGTSLVADLSNMSLNESTADQSAPVTEGTYDKIRRKLLEIFPDHEPIADNLARYLKDTFYQNDIAVVAIARTYYATTTEDLEDFVRLLQNAKQKLKTKKSDLNLIKLINRRIKLLKKELEIMHQNRT